MFPQERNNVIPPTLQPSNYHFPFHWTINQRHAILGEISKTRVELMVVEKIPGNKDWTCFTKHSDST